MQRQKYLHDMTNEEIIRACDWLWWCSNERKFAWTCMEYLAQRVTAAHHRQKERPPDGEKLAAQFAEGAEEVRKTYARAAGDDDGVACRGRE